MDEIIIEYKYIDKLLQKNADHNNNTNNNNNNNNNYQQ